MHREAAAFHIDHTPNEWWDLWHYHADWPGWGNVRWRYRREHLRALARVFSQICGDAANFSQPFQVWLYLSGLDAGHDATYLHTPSPNKSQFPMLLVEDFEWHDQDVLPLLQELLPGLRLRVGSCSIFDEDAEPARMTTSYFIYSPDVGIPLEPEAADLA